MPATSSAASAASMLLAAALQEGGMVGTAAGAPPLLPPCRAACMLRARINAQGGTMPAPSVKARRRTLTGAAGYGAPYSAWGVRMPGFTKEPAGRALLCAAANATYSHDPQHDVWRWGGANCSASLPFMCRQAGGSPCIAMEPLCARVCDQRPCKA
jgi:hypothetical protein